MGRNNPKLPTAATRDIIMSSNVGDKQSLPSGILESSMNRSPSPKVVELEDIESTRSNNPVELSAPKIMMTLANQAKVNGLVAFYPTSKISPLHILGSHMGDHSVG
jgi:hypothetical protein